MAAAVGPGIAVVVRLTVLGSLVRVTPGAPGFETVNWKLSSLWLFGSGV